MPRRGGSLYDSYQLSNSTAIPMFQGDSGQASLKVGQYMQGLYDTAQAGALGLDTNLDNMQGLPADKAIVDETREYYKNKLREATKNGDLENLVPQLHQLGAQYADDARAIAGRQQQRQEFLKTLDDKEKDLTSSQKQALAAISDYEDMVGPDKLKRNAQGKLSGSYKGTRVDKNIDINKWVRDNTKDIISNAYSGEAYQGTNGEWLVKTSHGTESVTPQRVRDILNQAMANDETVKGYLDMQGRINAHHTTGITDPNQLSDVLSNGTPNTLKSEALKYAKDNGVSFNTALQKTMYNTTISDIQKRALGVGVGTAAFTKTKSGIDYSENSVYTRKQKELEDATPTFIAGPLTKFTDDEKNPEKLQENIVQLNTDMSSAKGLVQRYDRLLKNSNLKPEERTQLESDRNNAETQIKTLQAQLDRKQGIENYAKMKTAQSMGYSSYTAFTENETKKILPEIKKVYPNGIITKQGKTISANVIAKAIVEGNYTPEIKEKTNLRGDFIGTETKGGTVRLPDGNTLYFSPKTGGKILNTINENLRNNSNSQVKQFEQLNKEHHKSNVENYSISDNLMTVSDAVSKDLKNALQAGWDGVKIKNPGSFNEISESDKEDIVDFKVVGHATPGPNGESRLMIQELDKEGKPTGKTYEAEATNSNINQKAARRLSLNPTVESQQAAQQFNTGAPSTDLKGRALGYTVDIGNLTIEGREVPVKAVISGTKSDPEYNIVDPNGKILKSTTSLGTINEWIIKINQ